MTALLTAISLLQLGTGASAAMTLSACALDDVAQPARCGVLLVPEDPARPAGRQLPIHAAVVPATSGKALPDPIVVMMGGPGEDAISAASLFAERFAALRGDRDLLLVDQRGTGKSAPLQCQLYSAQDPVASLRDLFPLAAVETCERRLSAEADLTQYTFARFASDLEQVRRALGYGPINVYAGSYGTRAAQVFVRTYPQSARTVYLGSVVPMDVIPPLTMAKTAQAVLDGTLDACAAETACREGFPNLREELRAIFARLNAGSVRVAVPGLAGAAQLHAGRVAEFLRSRLYRPQGAADVPWMIHAAYGGDWGPIVEGILSGAREVDGALSFGLFFAITCGEDVAFLRGEDVGPASQGTLLADYRIRQQQKACASWPKPSLPADYRQPVHSAVPTLFVSGDLDSATPLWFTERAASGFSERVEVVARGLGHTERSACIDRLYERFVRSGSARALEGSTCPAVPRPVFKLR